MNPIVAKVTTDVVTNGVKDFYSEYTKGNELSGTYDQGSNLFKFGKLGIYASNAEIVASDAQRIDKFFTRYGYAQNTIMQPNPVARPYFTYLQTGDDCYVNKYGSAGTTQGSANSKQVNEINAILRNGVTFWTRNTTSENIFKYDTLANDPT